MSVLKAESHCTVSKTGISPFFTENNAEMDGLTKRKLRLICFSIPLLPFGPVTPSPGALSHSGAPGAPLSCCHVSKASLETGRADVRRFSGPGMDDADYQDPSPQLPAAFQPRSPWAPRPNLSQNACRVGKTGNCSGAALTSRSHRRLRLPRNHLLLVAAVGGPAAPVPTPLQKAGAGI